MNSLNRLTAYNLLQMLKKKEIQVEDILLSLFARIEEVEERVKAYIFLDKEKILKEAKQERKKDLSFEIPVSVKDNICVENEPTRCASRILEGFKPPYDATVIKRLRQVGAILFGKTNMDEFAFGSSTETSAYQITRNPWNLEYVPGGSSGGSAAAVAADEAILALGSDTGGSIRQPAALCGIVGFKPTYGRVSRYGLIAFGSSLEQIGTLSKDVRDSALLLQVIAGFDEQDSTSSPLPVPDYLKYLEKGIKGFRIGIPEEYFISGLDKGVKERIEEAIKVFEGLGAKCTRVHLPHSKYALAVYYIIAPAEASSNLLRFDGVEYGLRKEEKDLFRMYEKTREEGFGKEAKRRIILGTYVLSKGYYEQYYSRAEKVRRLIIEDFRKVFEECDLLLAPTSPTPAWKIGEKIDNPLQMYLSDIFTIPANLAGIPAISVPCGFSEGLPVGLQILGRSFEEEKVLQAAYAYEQSTDWHRQRAKI